MAHIIDFEHGISAVDGEYDRPLQTSVHLIVEDGQAAIIDPCVNRSVPRILEALAEKGLGPSDVQWVILTHIHLDHAGGTGLLVSRLPNAQVTVHPRGARHMIDPSRLVEGTVSIYGEAETRRIYGDILPVPADRIVETPDETVLKLASREFLFLDSPGHARHHVVVRDSRSGDIFAGDTFGLSYRELDSHGRQYILPTTSPVQWDPVAHHASVDMMLARKPEAIYVTHYSQVRDVQRLGADLHRLIDAHRDVALAHKDAGPARHERLRQGVTEIILREAERYRWPFSRERVLEVLSLDIELNAQGLGCWLDSLK